MIDNLFWIEIIRIIIPGAILGIIVGRILAKKPHYLQLIKPKIWKKKAKKANRAQWIKLFSLSIIFGISTYFIEIEVGKYIISLFGPLLSEENIFTTIAGVSLPLLLASITILPILEEWIFRGVLLEEISRKSQSKWVGLLGSAGLFALFHLSNPGTYPAATISYFIGGILIGGGYLAGGLGVAVLAHILYNLMPFILYFVQ